MNVDSIIRQLESQYNPDYDLILNAPVVTCTDYRLLQVIKELRKEIEELKKENKQNVSTNEAK